MSLSNISGENTEDVLKDHSQDDFGGDNLDSNSDETRQVSPDASSIINSIDSNDHRKVFFDSGTLVHIRRASQKDPHRRGATDNLNFYNSHLSKEHATIIYAGGKFSIKDNGSTFGTVLNGHYLIPGHWFRLHQGDYLGLIISKPSDVVRKVSEQVAHDGEYRISLDAFKNPQLGLRFKVNLDYVNQSLILVKGEECVVVDDDDDDQELLQEEESNDIVSPLHEELKPATDAPLYIVDDEDKDDADYTPFQASSIANKVIVCDSSVQPLSSSSASQISLESAKSVEKKDDSESPIVEVTKIEANKNIDDQLESSHYDSEESSERLKSQNIDKQELHQIDTKDTFEIDEDSDDSSESGSEPIAEKFRKVVLNLSDTFQRNKFEQLTTKDEDDPVSEDDNVDEDAVLEETSSELLKNANDEKVDNANLNESADNYCSDQDSSAEEDHEVENTAAVPFEFNWSDGDTNSHASECDNDVWGQSEKPTAPTHKRGPSDQNASGSSLDSSSDPSSDSEVSDSDADSISESHSTSGSNYGFGSETISIFGKTLPRTIIDGNTFVAFCSACASKDRYSSNGEKSTNICCSVCKSDLGDDSEDSWYSSDSSESENNGEDGIIKEQDLSHCDVFGYDSPSAPTEDLTYCDIFECNNAFSESSKKRTFDQVDNDEDDDEERTGYDIHSSPSAKGIKRAKIDRHAFAKRVLTEVGKAVLYAFGTVVALGIYGTTISSEDIE